MKYFTGEKFQICGMWIYDINIADGITLLISFMHTARANAQSVHVWVYHIMPYIVEFGTKFDLTSQKYIVNLVVRKNLDLHCYLENVMTFRN